jgi:hypothetical protein
MTEEHDELLCRDCEYYAGERGTTRGTCLNRGAPEYQKLFTIHHPAPTETVYDDGTMEPIAEVSCFEEARWDENEGDEQTGGHA